MDFNKEIQASLDGIKTEVNNSISSVNEEVAKHGQIGTQNKQRLDEISNKIEEVTANILEMQQKGTSQKDIENTITSVGAEFTDSDSFKNFVGGSSSKAKFETQANLQIGDGNTVERERRPGIDPLASPSLGVRDVMGAGNTASNSIEYIQELGFTNNAAETQEGDFSYPESDITFSPKVVPVRNIGHYIPITKQMLEDAPVVASYINGRLTYGCLLRADTQALNGDGAGQNLLGMRAAANHTAYVGDPGDDGIGSIRKAMAQLELAEYPANAVIMNPIDVTTIDLTKATDESYVAANPRTSNTPQIWGLPIVKSTAMPVGQFLIGAFNLATQFTTRRGVVVEASESDSDNFTKDIVTLKATMRGAAEVYRPESLVGGLLVTP